MSKYTSPLTVAFLWHPSDANNVKPVIDYCYLMLSRNVEVPFSRSMNLPIFYYTSLANGIPPPQIRIESLHNIVFAFISPNLIADDIWVEYIENIQNQEDIIIIPIALDKSVYTLKGRLGTYNFIRAYEFEEEYINQYLFISITHEIYRFTLNESFNELSLGKESSLKIFISHAKNGRKGVILARAIKTFIDTTSMRNFFDSTDIAAGFSFEAEIIGNIKESSMVAINSDSYSSRFWCQKEMICAKENNRPIIVVDCLEEFEDRRFPHSSNIPSIRVQVDGAPIEIDLLRILCAILLETVRYFYSKLTLYMYKNAEIIPVNAVLSSRPPDILDLGKFIKNDGDHINRINSVFVYPEPPVYDEELSVFSGLGILLYTPLTIDKESLSGKRIGVSISEPSKLEQISIAQVNEKYMQLSQDLARHLLARGATVIYGGDLRPNGFTEFIFSEAQTLKNRMASNDIHIENYIAWPIYKKDTEEMIKWKVKYHNVAKMIEIAPPLGILDLIPDMETFFPPINPPNRYVWCCCLTKMREEMISACDARICVAGKCTGYNGKMPGVLEEVLIALRMEKPVFIVGGFGGITASIGQVIFEGVVPDELTFEWQTQNNNEYQKDLAFSLLRDPSDIVEYKEIIDSLKNAKLRNGLDTEDNIRLYNTPFIEEIVFLVLKGLKTIT